MVQSRTARPDYRRHEAASRSPAAIDGRDAPDARPHACCHAGVGRVAVVQQRQPRCACWAAGCEWVTIPNQSSVAKAFEEFDEAGRMKPSSYYDRIVDVMEELVRFTILLRPHAVQLVDRYSERKETRLPSDQATDLSSIATTFPTKWPPDFMLARPKWVYPGGAHPAIQYLRSIRVEIIEIEHSVQTGLEPGRTDEVSMSLFGYARVSTSEQDFGIQEAALRRRPGVRRSARKKSPGPSAGHAQSYKSCSTSCARATRWS